MLLDREGHLSDIDLLDHPWRKGQGRPQVMAAARADVDPMVEGAGVDGLGRECGAFVLGMSGLSADAAFVLALRRGGLGGLTMSEEGGLEEVEESLRAAASCWAN